MSGGGGVTAAILVARMGSSRLPGKAMMPVAGKPMVERMVERVRPARALDRIVLATSDRPEDDSPAGLAGRLGLDCYRGSAEDVLGRILGAARSVGAQTVVELLGDNPLVHPDLIDDVIAFYRAGRFDYAASATTEYPQAGPEVRKFPLGVRVQVYSRRTLERCARLAVEPGHREHATTYLMEHPELLRIGLFEARGRWAGLNRPELTFAVNYLQNLDLMSRIFESCLPGDPCFSLQAALATYEALPSDQKAWMGAMEAVPKCIL